ncbi:MerR family DNA-binding transcriptional regulator [Tautonia rosea]|uniref:MerR family DNA-binding transcriptional regulator n=1 Tax=Tautonia rosea TaxID=2728037 RepID=UPI0019D08DD7|nr:MerR family DNA-binding transcriptional regulator [Tautonia rosea]
MTQPVDAKPGSGYVPSVSRVASMRDRSGFLPLGEYLTNKDAARFLQVTPRTLRNWDRAETLTPRRYPINGYRLSRREDLKALLEQVDRGSGPSRAR